MKKNLSIDIIGAGIGGLTSAAFFAKNGIKVRVFERLPKAGGLVSTFKRGEYKFEATTHQLGGFGLKYYMTDYLNTIGINDMELIKLPYIYEVFFIDKNIKIDKRILLPSGKKKFTQKLIELFPESKKEIIEYINLIKRITEDCLRIMRVQKADNILPILIDAITALMLKKGKHSNLLSKIGEYSYKYMVKYYNLVYLDLIKNLNKELQKIVSEYCFYCNLPPEKVSAVLMAVIVYIYAFDAPYFIKGGTATLLEKLKEIITCNDGEIIYNTTIKKVIIENNKAKGLITEKGNTYYCDYIISDISTQKLFLEMIDNRVLPKEYIKEIKALELSQSSFCVYVGIQALLKDFGFESDNNIFSFSYSVNEGFQSYKPSLTSTFFLTDYSKMDKNFAPKNSSSIVVAEFDTYERWNNLDDIKYKIQKKETQDIILEKVEKITNLPIRKKADVIFSATPRTFKHYMGNNKGEIYAPSRIVNQSSTRRTSPNTPIEKISLVGAYTHTGAGVTACILNGVQISKDVLKTL